MKPAKYGTYKSPGIDAVKPGFMVVCVVAAYLASYFSFETATKAGICILLQCLPFGILYMSKQGKIKVLEILDIIVFLLALFDVFSWMTTFKLDIWHVDKWHLYYFTTSTYYVAVAYFLVADETHPKEKVEELFKLTQKYISICLVCEIGAIIASVGYFLHELSYLDIAISFFILLVANFVINVVVGMAYGVVIKRGK